MAKESKFAPELKEWGFSQAHCSVMMARLRKKIPPAPPTRKTWRSLFSKGEEFTPFFATSEYETNLQDELGECWVGPPTAAGKLKTKGFLNLSEPKPQMVLAPEKRVGVLLKMREWIEAELAKSELPGAEAFVFTSLSFCTTKVEAGDAKREVLSLLHTTVKNEPPYGPFDAMRPHRALFLINRTLATLA